MVAAFTWKLNCRRPVTGSVSSTRPELHKEETIPLDRSHTARTKTQFRQHQNHLAFRTPIHHLADLRTSQAVQHLTALLVATEYPLHTPQKISPVVSGQTIYSEDHRSAAYCYHAGNDRRCFNFNLPLFHNKPVTSLPYTVLQCSHNRFLLL